VDAVFYLIDHAEELGIDPHRIAVSGFSAGGNMSFTVPLRLEEELRQRNIRKSGLASDMDPEASAAQPKQVAIQHAQEPATVTTTPTTGTNGGKRGAIMAVCAFYPSCDYTATREERRKTNLRPDKELPRFFTDLFDMSYLAPPGGVDLQNIYLSPGLASDDVLRTDLPGDIVLFTCEWDGLRAEAERFKERLGSKGLGKRLLFRNIKGVMHAWDKSPNPFWTDKQAEEAYKEACEVLKVVFEQGKLQTIQE
jgi:acetyl esterase/lipase